MTEQTEQEVKLDLELNTLVDVINLIDICAQRGAFNGDELEFVGSVRNKVRAFVDQYDPPEDIFYLKPETEETEETNDES